MRVSETITRKLQEAFTPESVDVVDESHLHEGHAGHRPGGQSHFRVYIVSQAFAGKTSIEQHQLVYRALGELMAGPVHALALETRVS